MDYAMFSDAYAHNKRSKEHLINLLKTRVDKSSQFALFLGAGASVTSGVSSASEMITRWRKKLYASYKGKLSYSNWLDSQEWYKADDEYSQLFEMVYDQPSQRRAYIEKQVDKTKPGWGYAYLVSLISGGIFNVIFTTNFDDLINDACYSFTNDLRLMVCAHDSAVSSVRLTSQRPKVLKLHGDFLYDSIKNTSTELQSLESNMRDKFVEFAKELGFVVIGYGGNDQSIMDLLDVLVRSETYFRNGIYWCLRKSEVPSRRLKQLLRNDRVFWVEVDGFDEFMADLASATKCGLPEGIIAPHLSLLQKTEHLLNPKHTFSHHLLANSLSDLEEVYTRIREGLADVGLLKWRLEDNFEPTEMIDEMLPYLKGLDFMRKNKIPEACAKLRPIAIKDDSRYAKEAWAGLIECLMQDKSGHEEARQRLAAAPPRLWQDSSHYLLRSYFYLLLSDSKNASDFANRALELNRDLWPAKVNKAIALHILLQHKELAPLLKELESSALPEHYQAAAYAIEGKLEETMACLERAFVLGRYSPKSACRDVAFRVFWGLEPFEQRLRDFSEGESLEYPFREACPMSSAEKLVHERVSAHLNKGGISRASKRPRKGRA